MPRVAPRWLQEGPKMAPRGPKRAQDEARMAQHRVNKSKLKARRPNVKNLQQPNENQCFLRLRSFLGGSR